MREAWRAEAPSVGAAGQPEGRGEEGEEGSHPKPRASEGDGEGEAGEPGWRRRLGPRRPAWLLAPLPGTGPRQLLGAASDSTPEPRRRLPRCGSACPSPPFSSPGLPVAEAPLRVQQGPPGR